MQENLMSSSVPKLQLPFNKLGLTGNELRYMADAITQGHAAGSGAFTRRCQAMLTEVLGLPVLLTTSCTHALEMAALLLNIRPGDEVIVPSFAFSSTANAFVLRGAKPVFADIRPDTLNMDELRLEELITGRTRAIVPVHYAGVGCEMDAILAIAGRHGVAVVEDNAHGLFARYKGRYLGTFGSVAAQSFHETKNVICGEGGAIVLNDSTLAERAEILREKGTNRAKFCRGQVDRYTWVDVGSSYLLSDILAAFLYAQLERHETITTLRRRIWESYYKELSDWALQMGVVMPHVPPHCDQAYHTFYLVMPSPADRHRLIAHLKAQGIMSVFHYVPLHLSPMGTSFGGHRGQCPVTERVSGCLLRLPFFNDLSVEDQCEVIKAIRQYRCIRAARG
jgi:dTDP-4-amino-4,6-dideoxygalactose transaminase